MTSTAMKLLVFSLLSTVAALSSSPSKRVALQGLETSKFRHPKDQDLTWLVQSLPGGRLAEEGLRRSFSILEQGVRLDLLSTSVKVSEEQLPDFHKLMAEACQILDITTNIPELYLQSSPQANAYTLAFRGRDTPPIVVVTSALLEQCSEPEIQAILGHELGHIKCEHSLYLTLGGLASAPIRTLPFVGSQIDSELQSWRLAAEYTCDRASMLVAQDSHVVAGALLKLFAGTSIHSMSTDAFVAQCVEYDELLKNANPLVRASIQRQQRTHPLPVRRVFELIKWAESNDYSSIVKHGIELGREEEE